MTTKTANKPKIGDYREIISQIGGNKFLAMTGSKILHYGYNESGYVYIMMKLTRNQSKANHLKIQLNGLDLYDMQFIKIGKKINKEYSLAGIKIYDDTMEVITEHNDCYNDMLEDIFTSVTGLYTRLFWHNKKQEYNFLHKLIKIEHNNIIILYVYAVDYKPLKYK